MIEPVSDDRILLSLEQLKDCVLCPHECHVDRVNGKLGICKADSHMRVSRAALHHWEEPPISGSAGSGTIFLANCNLGCAYCQNHAISKGGAGKVSSIEDVAFMCLDLQEQGAMNINFVTPTHFAPLIRESIALARQQGLMLPIVWNTSGYESVQAIRENTGFVDIYLTDFKYFDDSLARELSHADDYRERARAALDEMVHLVGSPSYDTFNGESRLTKGVVIRHMLLPGHIDDSKCVLSMLQDRYDSRVLVSIMNQYTPVISKLAEDGDASSRKILNRYPELARAVSSEEYEDVLDFADSIGMQDYFWQDGDTCMESFIPDFE